MTLFAVMCAAIFPGIHVGRFWMAWYMAPIPNNWGIWQNFRSALMWDVFAVSTYFTVSVLFWYTGLVPDLATLRDRATTRIRKFLFGIFALGWRGSNRHWRHYEMAYLLLAGLSTPLVLSVHSVVSFDFASTLIPTWHTTIFPPYFVAGAIFGGFAMVLTLLLPARAIFKLQDVITPQHIDKMAKIILLTGSFVTYAYAMEFFIAWYSGDHYERFAFWNRIFGRTGGTGGSACSFATCFRRSCFGSAGAGITCWSFSSSACALTPACGLSALSLSQAVWSAIFCHRHGEFITPLGSISGPISARLEFSLRCSFCSSVSFR